MHMYDLFTMEQTGRDGATAKSEVALRTAQPSTLAPTSPRVYMAWTRL